MKFQVVCTLEKDCISKKDPSIKYNRVVLDFGKFKKIIVLEDLETWFLETQVLKQGE